MPDPSGFVPSQLVQWRSGCRRSSSSTSSAPSSCSSTRFGGGVSSRRLKNAIHTLVRLGWLRPLPTRGSYEFLAARGGPYPSGDPLVEARAVRARRPDFSLAIIGTGAAFLRGFSERAPGRYTVAIDHGQGGSVALTAAYDVVKTTAKRIADIPDLHDVPVSDAAHPSTFSRTRPSCSKAAVRSGSSCSAVYDLAAVTRRVDARLPLLREVLCFKAYFDRVEEGRDTLPVPFVGGAEFADRDAFKVVGADDLGLLARDRVDIQVLLRIIEATYVRIGKATGETETRLAACRFDDLHWARTRYAERARELRVAATT